ncbi:MAG TPA: DUF5666 domain-containing protein [Vicinamibacterales bacterium]|nr:DUF5666 domain-containing protein [Vicinamibacterales bacterium]
MPRLHHLAVIAILGIAGAACARNSPTAPTTGAGVTIVGAVTAPVPAGLQVAAGATSNATQVDGSGHFTLNNLPSGTIDLRFSGPGVNASLVLSNLLANQTVTLAVTVNGTAATLESARRVRGSEEEVEGRVESVTPPDTFIVAGRTVSTGGGTSYTATGQSVAFDTIAVGQRVNVTGQGTSSALVAAKVDILTPVVSGATFVGVIANLSGTRASFQFVVNGIVIRGDDNSAFDPGGQFNEMANGLQIQVTGTVQAGFIHATRLVFISPAVSLNGTVSSRSGTVPQLVLSVAGKTIALTDLTDVMRKGTAQGAMALATGQTVDISGRVRADGTIVAGTINILADTPGGGFWMQATITAASGSCPDVHLTVGGYQVEADVQTVFNTPCGQLMVGDKVEVIGIVRQDLSIMATRIQKI